MEQLVMGMARNYNFRAVRVIDGVFVTTANGSEWTVVRNVRQLMNFVTEVRGV